MDALLDHRGWWSGGPAGYQGPAAALPEGAGPHRVALVDVRVQLLSGPPGQLDEEVESALGPGHLVVVQDLGAFEHQCFAVEEGILERAEAWDGAEIVVPYPLAIQAWRREPARPAGEETQAIIERLGDMLLITVCQARRVLAYRQLDGDPPGRTQEIRRTLLALGPEAGLPTLLVAPDAGPIELDDGQLRLGPAALAPVLTLPASSVALRGLARVGPRAGFVSRPRARALAELRERVRRRRRAALVLGAAAVGGIAWLAGLAAERGLQSRKMALAREATGLEQALVNLAPRKLAPLLRPAPVREVGEILAAVPPELGLVQAAAEPDAGAMRLTLHLTPTDRALGNAEVLRAALGALPGLGRITVEPALGNAGDVTWQARGYVEASR